MGADMSVTRAEDMYRWQLTELPGSGTNTDDCDAAVVVSHGAWVNPALRGRGIGQAQHDERLKVAKTQGYRYIVCTVRADNAAQIHILTSRGWQCLATFQNMHGDPLHLYGRSL